MRYYIYSHWFTLFLILNNTQPRLLEQGLPPNFLRGPEKSRIGEMDLREPESHNTLIAQFEWYSRHNRVLKSWVGLESFAGWIWSPVEKPCRRATVCNVTYIYHIKVFLLISKVAIISYLISFYPLIQIRLPDFILVCKVE